ncbi:hypothetical protein ES703_97402 [subsurface metagenome]
MPYSSMKDVPKGLKGAGLNLRQANVWSTIYDRAKAGGAYNPAGVAWTAFKKKYKKVGDKWVQRAKQLARNPVEKIIFTHWGSEAIKMKPEILAKKIYELSQEHCPNIPVEIAIDNMTVGPPKKGKAPEPGERVFTEESLSNYLGSKRRFVRDIFKYIPAETKTLFDPMTGTSHVLIEAAKRGIRVIGNDLSPLAYLYSSGIFQGSQLDESDEKKFKNFSPISGWLSKSGLQRPKNLASKKLIDGLVVGAWKKFSAGKRRSALAALSLLLQHYFRGFQAFIAEEEPYSRKQILADLSKCIKDVNKLNREVGGKGKIFGRDILAQEIPRADIIYFDPPYFPGGKKEGIKYFNHYLIANSTLMQKKFQPGDPAKEDIIRLLPKLAKKAKFLIVTSASPSEINWEKELSKLKKKVKKNRISKVSTGPQPQGQRANPVSAESISENLYCATDLKIETTRKLDELLFKLEGYDPTKINDAQLGDDLRLVAAKWSSLLSGKKTEFKNKEECIDFAEKVMKEILKREKITFHPEYRIEAGKARVIEK